MAPKRTSKASTHRRRRDEEMERLKDELEHERRYRDTIMWSNTELERSIKELEDELKELNKNDLEGLEGDAEQNEWRVRLEAQLAVNKQLEEQKKWLELELEQARKKALSGSFPEAMNLDLDSLSEAELIRLVKHLQRLRNDLYSDMRNTEWKLDKEGKEFHHFDEIRKMYQAEMKHYNRCLDRLRLHQLNMDGGASPHFATGMLRWVDSSGIQPDQRILDPRKGPIRKTVGVRSLPKLGKRKGRNGRNSKAGQDTSPTRETNKDRSKEDQEGNGSDDKTTTDETQNGDAEYVESLATKDSEDNGGSCDILRLDEEDEENHVEEVDVVDESNGTDSKEADDGHSVNLLVIDGGEVDDDAGRTSPPNEHEEKNEEEEKESPENESLNAEGTESMNGDAKK